MSGPTINDPVHLLRYLLGAYDRLVDMHALVALDTPEDRDLHDRGLTAFRNAAQPVRAFLAVIDHASQAADRAVMGDLDNWKPTGIRTDTLGPFPVHITDAAPPDTVLIAGRPPHDADHPERYSAVTRGPDGAQP